ncbi:hypothetical protein AB0D98_05305 [Streptomyces sp. NPDC047987]
MKGLRDLPGDIDHGRRTRQFLCQPPEQIVEGDHSDEAPLPTTGR